MQVAGGADAGIVNLFHSQHAALPDNFRRKIDLVVRRTNARAELHDRARGIGVETINHLADRIRDELKEMGIELEDRKDGNTIWRVKR